MDEFSHETAIPVRFRDVDAAGHVNNAVYATYLEQARVEYTEAVIGTETVDLEKVIAHLELDYERSVEHGADVTVGVRVPEVGTSSIPMEYEIRADGATAATGSTVMVMVDPETGGARPLPEGWRERIAAHEGW
jgi:acyl-CoA thioester hydrolase